METIRKRINLEDARIRLSGCTIPFISGSEDSLGKIYYDIISSTNGYIRIKTEARKYNKLLNIIRNGLKLKKKSNLSDCTTGLSSESIYILADEFDILPISCDNYDLGYGVYSFDYFDKISDTEYETHRSEVTEDIIVLTNEIDDFERLGGLDKIIEVYQYLFCGNDVTYVSPYIELPILLNQDIADIGHMTDYQDDFVKDGEPIGLFPNVDGISVDTKHVSDDIPNPLSASTVDELSGFTTDSKLQFLRSKTIYTDDDGNVLPGLYSSVSANTFFRYTYHPSDETFTIARHNAASGFTCGDGEQLIPGEQVYRTASIPETAKRFLIENDASDGTYYFLIKNQNNSGSSIMDIPFIANPGGKGDRVINISTTEGFIIIKYEYNGVTYEETYKYDSGQTMTINLDGFENIEINYNKIDYEFTQQTIYNKHYGVEREGNLANITSYNVADVWGKDGSTSADTVNTPIFKEEYLLGVSSAFESEVDVTIDRGNAAAFERHFKLSECNTMEDLENYGNNIFNL